MRAIRNQLIQRSKVPASFRVRLGLIGLFASLTTGCAVHYHDAKTGTAHVWGLAHVKMRAAPAAGSPVPALATQTETFGLGLHFAGVASSASADSGLSLGWDRRTRVLVPDDAALSFAWPTSDLFDVRIGSTPPAPRAISPSAVPAPSADAALVSP